MSIAHKRNLVDIALRFIYETEEMVLKKRSNLDEHIEMLKDKYADKYPELLACLAAKINLSDEHLEFIVRSGRMEATSA